MYFYCMYTLRTHIADNLLWVLTPWVQPSVIFAFFEGLPSQQSTNIPPTGDTLGDFEGICFIESCWL